MILTWFADAHRILGKIARLGGRPVAVVHVNGEPEWRVIFRQAVNYGKL